MAKRGSDKQVYDRSGRGYSRRGEGAEGVPHAYPSDPAALRRLNTVINNKQARLPKGWVNEEGHRK